MANKKADVVIVGVGWVGGIVAAELTRAGLDVVGLERGPSKTLPPGICCPFRLPALPAIPAMYSNVS